MNVEKMPFSSNQLSLNQFKHRVTHRREQK